METITASEPVLASPVALTKEESFSRGSIWRKWDLHVHSPLSILSNQYPKNDGQPDWEKFLQKIETLDIAVLGISDYFTIEGYKKLCEFRAAGRLKNIARLLPNVEFRLSNVVASRKDGAEPRRLNLHVIFSDDVPTQLIEEHFLHDLHFYYEGSPQTRDETRKLRLSNIEELGAKLINEDKHFREMKLSPLQIGAMTTVVNHEEIAEILSSDSRFKDKYLIVLPDELTNLIDWRGQDHVIRQVVLQKSDMVFTGNERNISWCLGQHPYEGGEEAFIREFKTLKPCIHGSDAHDLDRIAAPCAKRGDPKHNCLNNPGDCDMRFCWVKADPAFEGLRQLLYEPRDRVRIQSSNPSPLKSTTTIDSFSLNDCVINDDLTIVGAEIPLNQGLVAITGGKGSGKTALVDLIASCYKDRRYSDDPNSFVTRILDDQPSLKVGIKFGDGRDFEKLVTEDKLVEDADITYIAQGELEHYVGAGSDLDQYINKLIFESPHVKKTVKAFEYANIESEIEGIKQRLASSHSLIERLEKDTADKLAQALMQENKQLDNELKDINARIAELEAKISKEKRELTETRQRQITSLSEQKDRLLKIRARLLDMRGILDEVIPHIEHTIDDLNLLFGEAGINVHLEKPTYSGRDKEIEALRAVDELLPKVVSDIESFDKEVKGFEIEMRQHAETLSRKHETEERLAGLKTKLVAIDEMRKKLETARGDRNKLFGELIRTVAKQKEKYGEVISVFAAEKAQVLSDLDFVAHMHFDKTSFLSAAEDIVDNRQVEVYGKTASPSHFETLLKLYEEIVKGDVSRTDKLTAEMSACPLILKTN